MMQTFDSSSISADQVMRRLKAFSSSPGGLSHAFTMDMVQQAIHDWSRAQGTVFKVAPCRRLPRLPGFSCQTASPANALLLLRCAAYLYIACALPVCELGQVRGWGNEPCSVICWTPAAGHMLHLCNALKFSVFACCSAFALSRGAQHGAQLQHHPMCSMSSPHQALLHSKCACQLLNFGGHRP